MPKSVMPIVNRQKDTEIEIRRVRIDDIITIVEIEKNSYPDPWSEKMFQIFLQWSKTAKSLVIYVYGQFPTKHKLRTLLLRKNSEKKVLVQNL